MKLLDSAGLSRRSSSLRKFTCLRQSARHGRNLPHQAKLGPYSEEAGGDLSPPRKQGAPSRDSLGGNRHSPNPARSRNNQTAEQLRAPHTQSDGRRRNALNATSPRPYNVGDEWGVLLKGRWRFVLMPHRKTCSGRVSLKIREPTAAMRTAPKGAPCCNRHMGSLMCSSRS